MLQLIPGEQGRVEFYPSHAESLVRLKDRPTTSMRQRPLMACEFVKPQDGEGTVNGLGWTRRQVRRESNILPGWDEVAFPDLQGTGAKSITVKLWFEGLPEARGKPVLLTSNNGVPITKGQLAEKLISLLEDYTMCFTNGTAPVYAPNRVEPFKMEQVTLLAISNDGGNGCCFYPMVSVNRALTN